MTITTAEHANGRAGTSLAIRPGQELFNDKQRAALGVLGIKDATNADLAVFMHYCQKTGLDLFSRQIYMICRRERVNGEFVAKQTIQVGIDGFRVIRDRIARREGITVEYEDTVWYDADGGAHAVWLWDEPPAACRVVVLKDGHRYPAVLRTASYMATKNGEPVSQWKTQPDHMIEKCAEAYALRRAFPHDLGGIYLEDELPPAPADAAPQRPQRVTAAEIVGKAPETVRENPRSDAEVTAEPPENRRRALSKTTLGRLQAALNKLPFTNATDELDAVSFLAGRPDRVGLVQDLSQDEAVKATKAIDGYLEKAGGDTEQAVTALWDAYHAAVLQDAAEAGQDTPEGSGD